ncbi:hypothetical protein [Ciceribacter ferrooxidans]|uniref:Transmembrane protein n=1 Tax=Ciceribacter ferrooxidans TaxID=2509717 RepID=A0A4Q2TEJ5_9HYPH|nr:hypothetical protein [Ciceribacter ferrooxidans]RYC15653.1 hypothetical protein EUU22_08505 [Ciceribacter ferrooxidans]
MTSKWRTIRASLMGLPLWVRLWLVVLALTNMSSLAFLDTDSGRWTAVAFAAVGVFNMPMVYIQGGLTRLLSVPHAIWIPLLIHLIQRLFVDHAIASGSDEYVFAAAVVAVNGTSLLFDVLESWRWLAGRREILGLHKAGRDAVR